MDETTKDLMEIPVEVPDLEIPNAVQNFLMDGRRRFSSISCFDFVPSNYENAYRYLSTISRGRFCEWGSGLGIVVGLAELLGFTASGIELNQPLAEMSRLFLADHGLQSPIYTGSYHEIEVPADYYYTYCWPSHYVSTKERFASSTPEHAKLIFCDGQDRISCFAKE